MWHALGRGEVFTGVLVGRLGGKNHSEDVGVGGRITLR
jgi:hypothetical protein